MTALALTFIFLNLVDAISTLALVQSGFGIEKNPAMAWLLSLSPTLFMVIKVSACALMFPFLTNMGDKRALTVLKWLVGVYAVVVINHILNWVWVFWSLS